MPPRKKSSARPPALSADDVSWLRAAVTAGEKPPVIVRAASAAVPAGTRGHVIRMGNPSEGEFIVVRLGRDEVPFAPAELALSPRARSAVKFTPGKSAAKSAPAKKATAKKTAAKKSPAKKAAAAKKTAAPPVKTAAPAKTAAPPAKPEPAPAKTTPARTRRTPAKRGGAQPLTVTVRYSDSRWTVEAQRGSRRLTRPSQLRPGAVKAFADLVDDEAIRDAITDIVESGRAVIEERAEKLRAELEAAEASLRDYESRRRQ